MRIDIISCVPKLLESPFNQSILLRAKNKGLAEVVVHDLRDYTTYAHKQIDDYAFGGGAGMVLMIEPIATCIRQLQAERTYEEIIYMTPDGEQFSQKMANSFSLKGNLLILCGHYKGVDERVRQKFITKEISIGDYVLSGGELAFVRVKACSNRHSLILASCPDSKTSGTANPSNSAGRVKTGGASKLS